MAAYSRKHFAELLYFNHDIAFPPLILTKAATGAAGPCSDLLYGAEGGRSRPPCTIPRSASASCCQKPVPPSESGRKRME